MTIAENRLWSERKREYRIQEGEKFIIHNVPYENCDCYGDTINMRDLAMVEFYVDMDGAIKEVDFDFLLEKYKDKPLEISSIRSESFRGMVNKISFYKLAYSGKWDSQNIRDMMVLMKGGYWK